MDESGLKLTGAGFLVGSLLLVALTTTKVWKDHSLKSVLLLLADFIVASILPIVVVKWISSGFGTLEKLLLAGFLFYLTTCVCYLLFPSTCERYSLPVASLYLVLAALQSLLTFLGNSNSEPQLYTFVYGLTDGVTVATLTELFMAELVPAYGHISSRLTGLIGCKLPGSLSRNTQVTGAIDTLTNPSQMREDKPPDAPSEFLKSALNYLRRGKYKSCIESCDTGVENMIVTTLLRLSPVRFESPMTIDEQVSRLESKEVPIRGKRIIRLRRMRNALTSSCREGTPDQAKWAIRVLRTTMKAMSDRESHTALINRD